VVEGEKRGQAGECEVCQIFIYKRSIPHGSFIPCGCFIPEVVVVIVVTRSSIKWRVGKDSSGKFANGCKATNLESWGLVKYPGSRETLIAHITWNNAMENFIVSVYPTSSSISSWVFISIVFMRNIRIVHWITPIVYWITPIEHWITPIVHWITPLVHWIKCLWGINGLLYISYRVARRMYSLFTSFCRSKLSFGGHKERVLVVIWHNW
jgi:hypothetical protein